MPRKGVNIYKRKDGRWEGRYIKSYSKDGKPRYGSVYAVSYAEVKEKLTVAKWENKITLAVPSSRYLFCEIAEKWLENVNRNCKQSTYNKYNNSYQNHIRMFLGKYPIAKIGGNLIDAFLDSLLHPVEFRKVLSKKTVQDICMIVKQIFLYAQTNFDIHPQFSFQKLRIKSEQNEVQTMTEEETTVLITNLLASKDEKKIGVMLCLFTGIRIGELCALRWSDISFENRSMKITKTLQRVQQPEHPTEKTALLISSPKSAKSNRTIPIPNHILKLLLSVKSKENTYLLSGTEQCVEPRVMEVYFQRYLKECGLPHFRFHALRHTFATMCIERGIDAKTLSEILGHSSVNVTLNRYVHSTMEMKREAINRLSFEINTPSEKWSKK